MDSNKWPTVKMIEGVACSLRIEVGEYEGFRFVLSVKDVKPGARYGLYYSGAQDDRWSFEDSHRGPTYWWRGDGTLVERYWQSRRRRGVKTREYMYYRSGQLFRFIDREDGYHLPGPLELLDEVFARDGTLIGCGYGKGDGDAKNVYVGYWMAKEVGYQEFLYRVAEAQTRTLR